MSIGIGLVKVWSLGRHIELPPGAADHEPEHTCTDIWCSVVRVHVALTAIHVKDQYCIK